MNAGFIKPFIGLTNPENFCEYLSHSSTAKKKKKTKKNIAIIARQASMLGGLSNSLLYDTTTKLSTVCFNILHLCMQEA